MVKTVSSEDLLLVTKNGEEQNAAVWGTAVIVDAGTYRVEARDSGHRSWESEVAILDGENLTRRLPSIRMWSGDV